MNPPENDQSSPQYVDVAIVEFAAHTAEHRCVNRRLRGARLAMIFRGLWSLRASALFADRRVRTRWRCGEIAAAAGISHALVLHHYRSKEPVREMVDEYVVQVFDDVFAAVSDHPVARRPVLTSVSPRLRWRAVTAS